MKWFFDDVIYLLCSQGQLKRFLENYEHFLENYEVLRKSENDAYNSGGRESCYLRHYDALRSKINM